MESDDLVMTPTQHRSGITRDQATRIADEHLDRLPNFVGAKVGKVVAWDGIDWRRPSILNAPRGIEEGSCLAYLQVPNESLLSRSSTIIIVSRETGDVLFAGSADDEG